MKKAIVAVDFSDASVHAARYAGNLANALDLEIHLLNVFHFPNPLQTLPIELVVTMDELETATDSKLKQLEKIVAREMNHPERIRIHSENGETGDAILHYGQYIDAALIIIGAGKPGFVKENLIGSTADALIRKNSLPILVVPQGRKFHGIKKILLTSDGKSLKEGNGLSLLKSIQNIKEALIEVVRFHQHREPIEQDEFVDLLEPQLKGTPHSYSFPETEHISESIATMAKDTKADLLVMESRHHSLLGQRTGLDHTRAVALHTVVPLLILPSE